MEKEIKIWDNVLIRFEDVESIPMVQFFWDTIGVETSFALLGGYYYIGVPKPINDTINVNDLTILSFEEAVEIYNKQNKTFPREMYVWDFDIESAEKEMVYFIVEKSMEVDQPVLVVNGQTSFVYGNAMEIEEYEALTKKQNENDELIKQIEKTEKELAELKSKLK